MKEQIQQLQSLMFLITIITVLNSLCWASSNERIENLETQSAAMLETQNSIAAKLEARQCSEALFKRKKPSPACLP